ncbi:3-oxoacyl-(acyl-carrier protein) reductase [Lactococcus lactis subsp. lactis]|uniref:3-oxoacyl-ACP reductase family protein n=1 Tax=Lactococcus lactis TaxID=1358 RepID=UPI00071D1D67|nr:3-oxoacyl-ACP reductase family protein [Lactococcus lactis]KST91460.1 3-oxoacyl-(acyl-carrier protein) reductase [Lactococcus lactis subsp. lactis]
MFVDVSKKVVVITGASRGIGKELARAFVDEGANVVINYKSSRVEAENLYNELNSESNVCLLVQADVTKENEVKKLFDKTMSTFGKVDILINNAGVVSDNNIKDMTFEQWQLIIDVNLTGTYLCSKSFSDKMSKQKYGKIINIASIKGQEGCVNQSNYSASKAGIIGLTKSLAKEFGKYNVSVNAVCPGFIVTDLNRNNKEKLKIARERSLLSINDSMKDLISFLVYMSSDFFSGVSGRVFNLDSRL